MHKECQILKVSDIVKYKLSKLINSLLSGNPKLPETLDKLIVNKQISGPPYAPYTNL